MAETVEQAIQNFEEASVGDPNVRGTLTDLLDTLNSRGGNVTALKLNGEDHGGDYFVRFSQVYDALKKIDRILMYDAQPTLASGKFVKSGDLYTLFNDLKTSLNTINGPEKYSAIMGEDITSDLVTLFDQLRDKVTNKDIPNNNFADAIKILSNTKDYIREAISDAAGGSEWNTYSPVTPSAGDNPHDKGWYEKENGEYFPTSDTTVDPSKTYYKATAHRIDSDTPFEEYPELIASIEMGSNYNVQPLDVTEKKLYTAPDGVAYTPLNVAVKGNGKDIVITENNVTKKASDEGCDYFTSVTVSVPGGAYEGGSSSGGYSGGGGSSGGGSSTPTTYLPVSPNGDENPARMGWYEMSGTKYVKTKDNTVQAGKTYYEPSDANTFNLTSLETDELGEYYPEEGYDGFNLAIVNVKEFPVDPYATFTVTFVDEDGGILQENKEVHYGTSVAFTGKTPSRKSDYNDLWSFVGWNPLPHNVSANIICRPVFSLGQTHMPEEIQDPWEDICNNLGAKYTSGMWKTMELAHGGGIMRFMKVAGAVDMAAGKGSCTSTWLAMDAIPTGFNNSLSLEGGWPNSNFRAWLNGEGDYLQSGFIDYYIPKGIAASIRKAQKTSVVFSSEGDEPSVTPEMASQDYLWLPSAREVYHCLDYYATSRGPTVNEQQYLRIESIGPKYMGGGLQKYYDYSDSTPINDIWEDKSPFMCASHFRPNILSMDYGYKAILFADRWSGIHYVPTRSMAGKGVLHCFNKYGKGSLDEVAARSTDPKPKQNAMSVHNLIYSNIIIGFCL